MKPTAKQLDYVHSQGWGAASAQMGPESNPFRAGTIQAAAWLAGWESYHFGR